MMRIRLTHCLFVLFLVGAACAPIANAQRAIKKGHSKIAFQNTTNATIHINAITSLGEDSLPPKIVKPKSTVSFTVKSGTRKFSLAAFLANPIRIRTIALQLKERETSDFRITPYMMDVYVLEDANARSARPTLTLPGTGKENPGVAFSDGFDMRCRQAAASLVGYVIWRPGDESRARYYREENAVLCALDGLGVYTFGNINAYFSCESGWRNCQRDTAGDAMFLPPVRTSNINDTPSRLARKDHPKALVSWTKTVEWLRADKPAGRITSYAMLKNPARKPQCPEGYRLHYQGFCINKADELRDDPVEGVRGVRPESDPK